VGLALNDAVVTAGPPYRMITICLRIDDQDGPAATGDGLIVSTAVGSTAYNVSAGGPILHPVVDAMVITPIAAHSLSFRPIVVPAGAEIELIAEDVNDDGRGGGTTLVLDGQNSARLSRGDRIVIRRHDVPVQFVRNPDSQYWATLINKMHWALPPRMR
jgi:NAD+ kinase